MVWSIQKQLTSNCMETKKKANSLNDSLKQLAEISEWFGNQKELDVETGIEK